MRPILFVFATLVIGGSSGLAGPFAPAAGQPGSTAIANSSPLFVEWASGYQNLVRGPLDIANPGAGAASFGDPNFALGPADGNTAHIVSLGDGGQITMTFAHPILNGAGPDLAVFENGFSDTFLELAFVEVSSNGTDFARFPSVSDTQTTTQVGAFGMLDPTNIDGLAGKYRAGFGTPFDLSQVAGLSANVDVNNIHFVRIVDVVGSINPTLGTRDSLHNLINDPYPTAFSSGGFDLNGVGALYDVPEPAAVVLFAAGAAVAWLMRVRIRHRPAARLP
jgi:hypothetical protein